MTKPKHSELPWILYVNANSYSIQCDGLMIFRIFRNPNLLYETWDRQVQDAKLIVQSVNSHYELVEALEDALSFIAELKNHGINKYSGEKKLRQVLSKARGENEKNP